jgi:malonyl-CoA/methylmalonyl-CoA synthetase
MSNYLFDLIQSRSPGPDALFLESADGSRLTYGDLAKESARFAQALASLGIAKGDRVAVQVEKSPQALITYLACIRMGAIFLPLNTAYTTAELEYFIGDAAPGVVVCDPTKRDAIAAIAGKSKVATLDASGKGSLTTLAAAQSCQSPPVLAR